MRGKTNRGREKTKSAEQTATLKTEVAACRYSDAPTSMEPNWRSNMPAEENPIAPGVRQVLANDWDPDNAGRLQSTQGAYDAYVEPLCRLIRSGADEAA